MKVKELIELLEKCDGEKELRINFITLGYRADTERFKIMELANFVDILPQLPLYEKGELDLE